MSVVMWAGILLCVITLGCHFGECCLADCHYSKCRSIERLYDECITLSVVTMNVIVMSHVVLSVVTLNAIMLSVVAPFFRLATMSKSKNEVVEKKCSGFEPEPN